MLFENETDQVDLTPQLDASINGAIRHHRMTRAKLLLWLGSLLMGIVLGLAILAISNSNGFDIVAYIGLMFILAIGFVIGIVLFAVGAALYWTAK